MHLEIYVARHCGACQEARAIARDVQSRFPRLRVDVIELNGKHPPARAIVATPTYLLDGQVVALGNPTREALERELRSRSAVSRGSPARYSRMHRDSMERREEER